MAPPCMDRDVELLAELAVDCAAAAGPLQLCRTTAEQRRCMDNNASLARWLPEAAGCVDAAVKGGCEANPAVSRWCPLSCGSCPLTPLRTQSVALVRKLCHSSCRLCPGLRQVDCHGEFGSWSACKDCRQTRVYRVLRPAAAGGRDCQFKDSDVGFKGCCRNGSRWRVVAAAPLPSFWRVTSVGFFEHPDCVSGQVWVRSAKGVQYGENGSLHTATAGLEDAASIHHSECIDCCTVDGIGPIASGSAPPPYGCENALMPHLAPLSSEWRSQCSPCQVDEAWLGFRTSGRQVDVRCVEVHQTLPTSGAIRHTPAEVRLEYWNSTSWQACATGHSPRDAETLLIRVGGAGHAEAPAMDLQPSTGQAWELAVGATTCLIVSAILWHYIRLRLLSAPNQGSSSELSDGNPDSERSRLLS